ncbi:daptide-type RiPP [Clostridium algidicarnis]|nr:hypothetical protein [Clostridium algidicarnis]MBU3252004.1 hypothetical protein [Clostridium algidicarnis]
MENLFNIEEFQIVELETIEAPLSDFQSGVAAGVVTGVGIGAIAAVAAC